MGSFRVAYWTDDQLRMAAKGFLAEAHPTGTLPIPIEEIVDLHCQIDIVPVENLNLDGHEAFTSRDRKTIYVEASTYKHKNSNRFRFTLAHELAHILLHDDVFKAADYTDIAGWKAFLSSIPDDQLQWIERQAFMFAGFSLVPTEDLSREYAKMAETLSRRGVDIRKLPPQALKQVAKLLGDVFRVSSGVIHRRAVKEGLWRWDDIPAS